MTLRQKFAATLVCIGGSMFIAVVGVLNVWFGQHKTQA